jgi:hypothetical protein
MALTPITEVPYIGEKTEKELRRKLDRSMGKGGQPVSVNEALSRKNNQVIQFVLSKRQKQELRDFDPTEATETIETTGFNGSRSEQRKQRVQEGEAQPDGDLSRVDQFGEALDAFSEEYQGETTFTGPDPTSIREGVFESAAPDDFQSIVPSAVNQRSFLQFPQEDKFEKNVEEQAGREDAVEPAKEAFVEFVDQDIGLGPSMRTFGEFQVSSSEYEEAQEEFAQQSPEAKRVDKRRRAPITTNEDVYAQAPGRYDFPGVDTPSDDPKVKRKDRNTVDADETTLETTEGSLFVRENNTTGGVTPSLEGLFSGGRGADPQTRNSAAEIAAQDLNVDVESPSGSEALADVMFLERDKDGFGEELIPFAAEESERQRFEF